eukprot:GGOE01023103.1.p1 GENE.GGOE01023103.1~~GGOE01023103.1.p1  ORF type:complete len:868 (+),score=209.13 GGOE01023103.1:33-2606(+)
MAEARQAVAPMAALGLHTHRVDTSCHTLQLAITQDGFVFYMPHLKFMARNVARSFHRARNNMASALWPASLRYVVLLNFAGVCYVLRQPQDHWLRNGYFANLLWNADSLQPWSHLFPTWFRVAYLANFCGTVCAFTFSSLNRIILRSLLKYKGWIYESKPSFLTKLWAGFMKYGFMRQTKPLLYTYQGVLPKLPVPTLEATCKKYLASVKPLLSETEFLEVTRKSEHFQQHEGRRLQQFLQLRSWTSDNYVSEWWLNFVYLRSRSSLMINSNYYGIGEGDPEKMVTTNQVARAASLIFHLAKVKQMIDHEALPPHTIRDLVPLCMQQYQHVFSSTRIPGKEMDSLRKWDSAESRHIVVFYKGLWYRVQLFLASGKPLTMFQIQSILQGIVDSRSNLGAKIATSRSMPELSELGNAGPEPPREDPAHLLPALTTENRTEWAFIRERHFSWGVNRASLDVIERAQFVVHLDDAAPADWTAVGRLLFHGTGANRWCDKSFNLVVFANGKCGIHAEHSWGDAPTMAHCLELALAMEQTQTEYRFDQGGDIRARSFVEQTDGGRLREITSSTAARIMQLAAPPYDSALFPVPKKPKFKPALQLGWEINADLSASIHAAVARARDAIRDIDLIVRCHDAYGKGFIKRMGVGPDAFVQMVLQVAYFRDQGAFCQTYESSMARLFLNGRTETIRTVSEQSCAFVRAFEAPQVPVEEKRRLLQAATTAHQLYTRDSMVGRAIDRHLFGLYVVSCGMGVESPFLNQAMSNKWRLSTSQVPPRQTPKNTWPGNDQGDKFHSPSGGFGPVADDGYGVSYCITGENRLYFHVSSKRSAGNTSSQRFLDHIFRVLAEMQALLPEPPPPRQS